MSCRHRYGGCGEEKEERETPMQVDRTMYIYKSLKVVLLCLQHKKQRKKGCDWWAGWGVGVAGTTLKHYYWNIVFNCNVLIDEMVYYKKGHSSPNRGWWFGCCS